MDAATMVVRNVAASDRRQVIGDLGLHAIVDLGRASLVRVTHRPGWRWSEHSKPSAGTDWCERRHVGYVMSGREHVRLRNGAEYDLGPDDAFVIPPGHDAWVVGDEPYEGIDFACADDA